jgi:hypothetical protein
VLFGGFPCYGSGGWGAPASRCSPLPPGFDRVLQLGDAAAGHSPLSFGGFGGLLRHLPRLTDGLDHALRSQRLSRSDLTALQPYQPGLSAAWLFQRAMSIGVGQLAVTPQAQQPAADEEAAAPLPVASPTPAATDAAAEQSQQQQQPSPSGWLPANHVNALLGANFAVMRALGSRVLRPFLQDTLQLLPLTATMVGMLLVRPLVIARVLRQVGPRVLTGWLGHFVALAAFTVCHKILLPLVSLLLPWLRQNYTWARMRDAVRYGCGGDYVSHNAPRPAATAGAAADAARAATAAQTARHGGGAGGDAGAGGEATTARTAAGGIGALGAVLHGRLVRPQEQPQQMQQEPTAAAAAATTRGDAAA